ncbi:MAG: ubiquinol-cytochrome c reductase iron-sulfur subunit N-terminal domain-containing protein, partial [Woeseiales bacterium]
MTDDVDRNRRHFLTVATLVTGGAGLVAASIPFLASLKPSA